MRIAVVVLIVVAAASTRAHAVVIRLPAIVRQCGEPKTWAGVAGCLRKQGTVRLVQQASGARLYQVTFKPNERDPEAYLYIERRGVVRLAGIVRDFDKNMQLLALARVTIARHTGWRLELGETREVSIQAGAPDGLMRRRISVYCSGEGWRCTHVVTSCDVLVRGKTRNTFRGKVVIRPGSIQLVGDRSHAGIDCAVDEDVFLDWPIPELE